MEIAADDGDTSASYTYVLFCCADADAVVFGDALGSADPASTPHALTHFLEPGPLAGRVGAHPIALDIAGSLTWTLPSGPSLAS